MYKNIQIVFFLVSLSISIHFTSCSSEEDFILTFRPSSSADTIKYSAYNDSLGRINAVKKARQLTDIEFTPISELKGLGKTYHPNKTYNGIMYSMVSEMSNYVGSNVSFHTFMTAVHNPKSKLYTENVSQPPYHGRNCNSYYGSVCSQLVSYALGISPGFSSRDFNDSDLMLSVNLKSIDSIKVADVLWKSGHVALISDIERNEHDIVTKVEICESVPSGCRRYSKSRDEFEEMLGSSFKKILRYSELYKNLNYTPVPEFVAVLDETPISYHYNDDLCVDKGDKSCYLESDSVVINTMHEYDYIELYKGEELYRLIDDVHGDVSLTDLPYGDYKARAFYNGKYSDYTYWKVVNVQVYPDNLHKKLYFHSENAKPRFVSCRDIAGLMETMPPTKSVGIYIFEEEDIQNGYIDIEKVKIRRDNPYVRVQFSTEYGTIINKPFNWFE